MLKKLFQSYQMVFMNYWYIKHYGARVGDDFVIKKLKITNFKSNGYSMNIDY